MTSVRFSGKNRAAIKQLANEWKCRTYDDALSELFSKFAKLDPDMKQILLNIEYFDIETKIKKAYSVIG